MEFEKISDNLTFKRLDSLEKMIQSVNDHVLNHCFWIHAILKNFDND